jgi:hypothetical protein
MDTASSVALVTAVIAGSVALIGYFKIRRRSSSDSATREALGREWSDVLSNLIFYLDWLNIESPLVGLAYADLFEQTRKFGRIYRTMAWKEKVFESDEQMADDLQFGYANRRELELCLMTMRREMSMWSFAFRRSTSTALALQREARAGEGEQ